MSKPLTSIERKIVFMNVAGVQFEVDKQVIVSETRCPAAGEQCTYLTLADGTQIPAVTDTIRELVIIRGVKR